jgi:hypothetical protein
MTLDGLSYEEDVRKEPTSGRKANFKQGWTRAVEGQEYEDVLEELTWNNLGWRLGQIFGETPEYLKDEMWQWCIEQRDASDGS